MTSLIKRRSREDHRRFFAKAMDARADEALRVRYDVNIDHLTRLTATDFDLICAQTARGATGEDALDRLYQVADR